MNFLARFFHLPIFILRHNDAVTVLTNCLFSSQQIIFINSTRRQRVEIVCSSKHNTYCFAWPNRLTTQKIFSIILYKFSRSKETRNYRNINVVRHVREESLNLLLTSIVTFVLLGDGSSWSSWWVFWFLSLSLFIKVQWK